MKIILLASLAVFSIPAFSQSIATDTVSVATCRTHIKVSTDAEGYISVEMPQVNMMDAQRDWLDYIGYGSRGMSVSLNGECLQAGVVNPDISPDPFNLSSRIVDRNQGVRLTVWFTQSDMLRSVRVKNMDRDKALQKYVVDFAMLEYRRTVKDELKYSRARQSNLENQLSTSISDESRFVKMIKENQANIKCASEAVIIYADGISKLSDQIKFQWAMSGNPIAQKGKEDRNEVARLEAERSKLIEASDQALLSIHSWTNEIRNEARRLVDCRKRQTADAPNAERQRLYVEDVKAEFESVK